MLATDARNCFGMKSECVIQPWDEYHDDHHFIIFISNASRYFVTKKDLMEKLCQEKSWVDSTINGLQMRNT